MQAIFGMKSLCRAEQNLTFKVGIRQRMKYKKKNYKILRKWLKRKKRRKEEEQ